MVAAFSHPCITLYMYIYIYIYPHIYAKRQTTKRFEVDADGTVDVARLLGLEALKFKRRVELLLSARRSELAQPPFSLPLSRSRHERR